MENEMLEQIQQMITTATVSLRREMGAMKAELREDIADGKRYAGILAEDLHHKLDLVIEGQQFLGQRIDNVQADLDAKTRETRLFLEVSHRQFNDRLDRHEQSHHT